MASQPLCQCHSSCLSSPGIKHGKRHRKETMGSRSFGIKHCECWKVAGGDRGGDGGALRELRFQERRTARAAGPYEALRHQARHAAGSRSRGHSGTGFDTQQEHRTCGRDRRKEHRPVAPPTLGVEQCIGWRE